MIVGLVGRSVAPDSRTYTMRTGKDEVAKCFVRNKYAQIAFGDPIKRVTRELWDFSRKQLWGPSEAREQPDTRYPREHGPWRYLDKIRGVKCACCGFEVPNCTTVEDSLNCTIDFEVPDNLPQCYLTPRFALQRVGTEVGCNIDSQVWVRKTMRTAQALLEPGQLCASPKYDPELGLMKDAFIPRPRGVVISDVRVSSEVEAIRETGLLVLVKRLLTVVPSADAFHRSEVETLNIPEEDFDFVIYNYSSLQDLHDAVSRVIERIGARS
jgi:hypothetical protein